MSLINDALKQAKRTEPRNLAPADGPSLFPVERARRSGGADFLMISLITVILLLAGLLLWQWLRGDGGVVTVRAKTASIELKPVPAVMAAPAPAPIAVAAPVAPPTPDANAAKQSAAVAPNAVQAIASVTTNLEAAVPPKPAPVTYKLQSIFYFAKNPTAVINGKTVSVGSRVGEARVLAITKDSATIVTATGQTNFLELP